LRAFAEALDSSRECVMLTSEVIFVLLKKAALLLVSLLLVAAANLRLVYSVSVDGAPLEGSWSRQSVENAYDAAMAAAEEVARGGAVPPELETEARLSILPARGEVSELAEAILCSAGGVEMAWAVSVDGVELGCVGDISALSEQLESVIGSQIPHSAVSAGFDANIAIRPLAIPEGTQSDLTELSGAIRGLARVYYVTPDGAQRYA